MITPYKDRECDMAQKVMVYRNLHNQKFSVLQDGLVVGHTRNIILAGCTFVIQESGRQRVLRDHKKNVHAYVKGMICGPGFQVDASKFPNRERVRYNPYEMNGFCNLDGRIVDGAPYVELDENGHIYIHH